MQLLPFIISIGVVFAKTSIQIINEIGIVEQYTSQLQDLIVNFEGDTSCRSSYFHNMKVINNLYKLNTNLQDSMVTVTESMENNCDCSYGDSKRIIEALTAINEPMRMTLSAFKAKRNDFYSAYGVYVTDHIIVSAIKRWRVLTLNLLSNVKNKTDPQFSSFLSSAMCEFDRRYRHVLTHYIE